MQRVRKYLGSYLVRLNGQVDAVVFTGGIGERDADLRGAVLEGLSSLGLSLDEQKNQQDACDEGVIALHSPQSKAHVLVVRTNEELSLCLQAVEASGVLSDHAASE